MDTLYRIRLLLAILPLGIGAGVIVTIITWFIMKKRTSGNDLPKKMLLIFSVSFYAAFVIGISFFHSSRLSETAVTLPFAQFAEAIREKSTYLLFNVLLNVLIFMPFGFFMPLLFKKINNYSTVLSISLLSSCCIELIQMVTRRGAFSCDDVIGGLLGAALGYGVVKMIRSYGNKAVSFTDVRLKKEFIIFMTIFAVTVSVFTVSYLYCRFGTSVGNVYYSDVEKVFNENKETLADYAHNNNYSNIPDIENIRDMSYSDDWFRLELGRRFNGTDLTYFGLFYLNDQAAAQNSTIVYGSIGTAGDDSCYYDADDGTHYELKQIEDGFFYYMVRY